MIEVLKPGFYTSIQDFGRFGVQQYGVPYSGVMDRESAGLANSLLANAVDAPVLEITMTGPVLRFITTTFICVSGADLSPKLNDKLLRLNKVVYVKSGDVLSFGKLNNGFRCYLAVKGGFVSDLVLNGRSWYEGITQQAILKKNNGLEITDLQTHYEPAFASLKFNAGRFEHEILEVFKGPEFDLLTDDQKHKLFTDAFSISKHNSRMAYQLNELVFNDLPSILTVPVLPGTVQLTPSGQLIILMRDAQTTGGYPRVLQLTESAINLLAQKHTGHTILFKAC